MHVVDACTYKLDSTNKRPLLLSDANGVRLVFRADATGPTPLNRPSDDSGHSAAHQSADEMATGSHSTQSVDTLIAVGFGSAVNAFVSPFCWVSYPLVNLHLKVIDFVMLHFSVLHAFRLPSLCFRSNLT